MRVLVDTSVWVRFLEGTEPWASELDRLLAEEGVLGHDFVHGELLVGDVGGRKKLLSSYSLLPRCPSIPHADVVGFVSHRRVHGRGIGWIDAHLIASAIVGGALLWTADGALSKLARSLDVAHTFDHPTPS